MERFRAVMPGWKLRRELARLGQQLRAIPEAVTDPIRQRHHDRVVFPALGFREGGRPLGPKVAIYLLYQPKGIAPSTVYTCGFLASKGYSVLVVSNAPVSEADAARLSPEVWRIVERPNLGYDFGGYRDGIRLLWRWEIAPETLLVLNDSVWFPLDPRSSVVEDLEDRTADLAGMVLRRRGEERFIESYLYRIRGALFRDLAFRRYWEDLRLTSNKYHVIRRGERGFSRAMLVAGHAIACLNDNESFLRDVGEQDEAFLRRTLDFAAYVDPGLAEARDRLLLDRGEHWRRRALDHIATALGKFQAYSTYPYAATILGRHSLLKKSRDPVGAAWRAAYLHAVAEGALPPPPDAIGEELRARTALVI